MRAPRFIAGPLALTGLAIGAFGLLGCEATEPSARPAPRNVLLISLDTLRADHLGVYGYERNTSPRLDALASESLVFERTLAPAPNTPPSQMSMMTSLYPGRHGFTGKRDSLAPGVETLAGRLRDEGFATAGFVDAGFLRAMFGFARGFDSYDDEGGGIAAIAPKALRWLDEHPDERFFLFVHCYDIHAPYFSPEPYDGMFHERPYSGDLVPTAQRIDEIWRNEIELGASDLQHLLDSYDEGIRYTDARVGELLDAMAARGRLADTLVIVTSDHGEEFGEHGSVSHWRLYFQPNLRIPLIVRPPGGEPEPLRVRTQAELVDVLPTVLDLVGATPLEAAQGRSLAPAMRAAREERTPPPPRDDLERAALAWWPDPRQLPRRSIVLDDHQLIFDKAEPANDELYDLAADPLAQRDIVAEEPALAARLRELGLQGMAASPTVPGAESTRLLLDEKVRRQLEALGYRRFTQPQRPD
jgi:arylsulfatase A-like enzyme